MVKNRPFPSPLSHKALALFSSGTYNWLRLLKKIMNEIECIPHERAVRPLSQDSKKLKGR